MILGSRWRFLGYCPTFQESNATLLIALLFQGVRVELVAVVAIFGLSMVWLVGWRREKQLYRRFYDEELARAEYELSKELKGAIKETVEETIEEQVQKALRQRWR